MTRYCKVKGRWTTAVSDIDTTCRWYSPPAGCRKKEGCEHKSTDPNVRLIGKKVKDVTRNSLVFEDGSTIMIG